MKSKQDIVDNWLPRYTGVPLDQFGQHILLTNFSGYLHAFAMTDQHLVFVMMPFDFTGAGGSFFERMQFAPQRPVRIAVVAKDAPDKAQWFEAPFAAIYHFGDAFTRDGGIVLRAVRRKS